MPDNTEKKLSGVVEKAAAVATVFIGTVAAAAILPQDKIAAALPSIWQAIKDMLTLGALKVEQIALNLWPRLYGAYSRVKSFLIHWAILASVFIGAGIMAAEEGYGFGRVLVAIGTILFAGLGVTSYALGYGLATATFLALKFSDGVLGKTVGRIGIHVPIALNQEDLDAIRRKTRVILAATCVMCFSFVLVMLFPSLATLGWLLILWALIAVAAVAAMHLNLEPGKAVKLIFTVTLALIGMTTLGFLIDRMTGGALKFGALQSWIVSINRTEIIAVFLILIPVALFLTGVFTKDKDRKASFFMGAKYVGIGCCLLAAGLIYRGTMQWKQLVQRDAPQAVKELDVAVHNFSPAQLIAGTSGSPPPSGSAVYMTPPPGTSDPAPVPLPPIKAKQYKQPAEAVADLDSPPPSEITLLPPLKAKEYASVADAYADLE